MHGEDEDALNSSEMLALPGAARQWLIDKQPPPLNDRSQHAANNRASIHFARGVLMLVRENERLRAAVTHAENVAGEFGEQHRVAVVRAETAERERDELRAVFRAARTVVRRNYPERHGIGDQFTQTDFHIFRELAEAVAAAAKGPTDAG